MRLRVLDMTSQLKRIRLSELIEQRKEKFDGIEKLPIRGVSKEGFIPPKQKDADTSIYNVFYKNDFVFNPARMELNSIALNKDIEKGICSSLYEIFFVKRTDIILPEYLNMFIKRDEFARRCWFNAIGSARNYFRVPDLGEFEIVVPSIKIQKKYVAVFESLESNLSSYENGLDDLRLVYEGFFDKLKKEKEKAILGDYITEISVKNESCLVKSVLGVNSTGEFGPTKANMFGIDTAKYKVVRKGQFAYNPSRINLGSIAMLDEDECIISPMYVVFEINNDKKLNPIYLNIWLQRKEFLRSTLFYSIGSVRDTFDFNLMCKVEIPLPSLEIQNSIANIFLAIKRRKSILSKLKSTIDNICPILIRGSLLEAEGGESNAN